MPSTAYALKSPKKPDAEYIQSMFDGLAARYDLFTLLTGFGQAARWREKALRPLKKGMRLLDLGCGTGDLALAAIQKIYPDGEVVGLDFSKEMLGVAQKKYDKLNLRPSGSFSLIHEKAENLPVDNRPFDLIVSGFVLRNLYENIDRILAGVYASLKQGGRIGFLDLTLPVNPVKRMLWKIYFLTFVGIYGALLFGGKYPIPYLPDSAERFLNTAEFKKALEKAGFKNITATPFMLGSVTLYEAEKF